MVDFDGNNKTLITASNPHITAISGQKAILRCIFDNRYEDLSSYQLIWIRQSRASYDADLILAHNQHLLVFDDRLNVQRTENDYTLIITDVTVDDEGIYVCEINTLVPQNSFIHLHVQETTMIIDNATSSSPMIVNEYDNVTIECQAKGRPKPYIAWFRRNYNENNQAKLDNQVLANDTNGQLRLFNISRHQMGHYECRASNGVNEHVVSKDIELRVLFPPSIQTQSSLVYGTIGKPMQLRCSYVGPFDTKIYWHRIDATNTNVTNDTMKKLQYQQYVIDGVTQTVLNIKDIHRPDFGSYGCVAESMAGQSHAIIELKEYRRLTTTKIIEIHDISTSRLPILKRNQISDQTTISMDTSKASSCFSSLPLSFTLIQMILCTLT